MAKRAIPAFRLLFAVSLSLLSCVTKPLEVAPDDPLFGTWVNEKLDRPGSSWPAKKVLFSNGRELVFNYSTDAEPSFESRNSVEKTWIDSEGSHWYRIRYTSPGLRLDRFVLCRVNAEGTVLELINSRFDYPQALDPADVQYMVYYKLE